MLSKTLGTLQRVDIREVFESEAADFTPWLAQENNLRQLGDALGIELELEAQEKEVGGFRADLLCKDTASSYWVLIENQLERTDHTHLGQLLTYAAGLDAVTVIWIAQKFTDEHRAGLDWLNEHTDENINFFGLEIELYRIGDSEIAPRFNIVSQPNEWSRTAAKVVQAELTETKKLQIEFWTWFREYMSQHSAIKCHKANPQHWMNHPIGRSGMHLSSIAAFSGMKEPEIRVELILESDRAKEHFAQLFESKSEIEKEIGFPLIWYNPENKNMCRIYTQQPMNLPDRATWNAAFQWLQIHLEAFQRIFAKRVRALE